MTRSDASLLTQVSEQRQLVSIMVGDQLIGVPIEFVRDVFQLGSVTPVPLTSPAVAGLTNLRGKIVTILRLSELLGMISRPKGKIQMVVGVEWRGETFGICVDQIGDVLTVLDQNREPVPTHMTGQFMRFATCFHKLENALMIELNLNALLDLPLAAAA